jgi:Putative DNA-binding domain
MNPQLIAFFESISTEADIIHFRSEGREEDLHLEFKRKANPGTGAVEKADREAFSEALSGFANADGGILIFGVGTKKTRERPDRAAELKPIADVEQFRSGLIELILQTVQPSVDGVRIETVLTKTNAKSGYVKCLIPDSDKPPHRSMHAGREYYRRSSNSMRRMEHYELEDMFGRRLRPLLRLGINFSEAGNPSMSGFSFYFLNVGRGVAKHAGFHCTLLEPESARFGGIVGLQDATQANSGRPSLTYYDQLGVVHPNGIRSGLGEATFVGISGVPVKLKLIWYAENMLARHETIALSLGEGREIGGFATPLD